MTTLTVFDGGRCVSMRRTQCASMYSLQAVTTKRTKWPLGNE